LWLDHAHRERLRPELSSFHLKTIGTLRPHGDEALARFLEECGKIVAEAARRGDLPRAHEFTELAARAAARKREG
jgi:hypothetical protein